ncbi:hypothetical protein J6590_008963 [Homalodisca vitripennis]|nr:hypothetical protein J6590_008963 [Homalodisca vitripennis]
MIKFTIFVQLTTEQHPFSLTFSQGFLSEGSNETASCWTTNRSDPGVQIAGYGPENRQSQRLICRSTRTEATRAQMAVVMSEMWSLVCGLYPFSKLHYNLQPQTTGELWYAMSSRIPPVS